MGNTGEILNELRSISPLIASMEKVNLWKVPDGYFDQLPQKIADRARGVDSGNIEVLHKGPGQDIPEGYFENLSQSILARIKSMEVQEPSENEAFELPDWLIALRAKNVFQTPQHYFEDLDGRILETIRSVDQEDFILPEVLSSLRPIRVFRAPEGYFDHLSDEILAAAKLGEKQQIHPRDELKEIAPVLAGLKDRNVFEVPEGYFEQLEGKVRESLAPAAAPSTAAKVVSMKRRTGWIRYAVAAAVTGIITVSSLQYFKYKNASNQATATANTLANLPGYVKESLQYKSEEDLNAGLAQLSDAEIIKYLEKNGNIMDNELLMNNADESGLPSQNDYLNDSNTLNNYLDKIKSEKIKNATP
jgi:hypothetical protein